MMFHLLPRQPPDRIFLHRSTSVEREYSRHTLTPGAANDVPIFNIVITTAYKLRHRSPEMRAEIKWAGLTNMEIRTVGIIGSCLQLISSLVRFENGVLEVGRCPRHGQGLLQCCLLVTKGERHTQR